MTDEQHTDERPAVAVWLLVLAVGLGVSAGPLDSSVNVAFPSIVKAFGVSVESIQWVVVCYVLTYASLLLGCGRLADLIGHRRVFVAGIVWSIFALLGCALATDFEWFLAARVAQGLGTALILSTGPALLTLSFPPAARTRLLALYALAFSIANATGPLAGGLLVDTYGWSSVFWFRVPILVIALLGAWLLIPSHPASASGERFDWPGAALMVAVIVMAIVALNQLTRQGVAHAGPWLAAGVTAALTLAFIKRQLAVSEPIIELRLFRNRLFATANLTHVLVNCASFSIMLLVPFYLSRALGGDVAGVGIYLAVYPLGAMAASLFARAGLERLGAVNLSQIGLGMAACGLLMISFSPASLESIEASVMVVGALALHGFGYGLFQVAAVDVVMATMPRTQQGVGGSLNMLTRTLGVVAGASFGSILFAGLGGGAEADTTTFHAAYAVVFRIACALVLLAMGMLALISRRDTREADQDPRGKDQCGENDFTIGK
jgi:MFS family permease